MLLRDADAPLFKAWVLPQLESISDADASVLADYVIALITANEEEESVRQACRECLGEFLGEGTERFVERVLAALGDGRYKVGKDSRRQTRASQASPIDNAPRKPNASRASNTPPANAPTGPTSSRATNAQNIPTGPRNGLVSSQSNAPGIKVKGQGAKKRKQPHRDASETPDGQDPHYNRTTAADRPMKQATRRRGAAYANKLRAGAASFETQGKAPASASMPQIPNMSNPFSMANLPPPPPGPMPFNVNDPMAFFTMMAALGMSMPGMAPMPNAFPSINGMNGKAKVGKCHSYHEKGFCALGAMCSFQHGEVDDDPEYDPNQPSLSMHRSKPLNQRLGVNKNYGKGGRARADISLLGPTTDRTNTTLVVEQIPQEYFTEDHVRSYFSEFGTIVDFGMHNYKRVAVIKYADHSAAARAYNSPKAVFENRFVKVYWKRPDTTLDGPSPLAGDTEMEDAYQDDEEVMSPAEIAQRQAEAQKAFEERRRKYEETEARSAEIDRLLKEKDAEMRKIRKQLAELAGEEENEANSNAIKDFSNDLATLQAEAENLFGTTETPSSAGRGGPVRGGSHARVDAPYSSRGRGSAPLRGRGAPRGGFQGGRARVAVSVKRLDNRPRRLAVSGIVKGSHKDEALRQYLLGLPECTNIDPHPETPDTLILTFQHRYQAESFLYSSRTLPSTGPLDLTWIPNDALGGLAPASTTTTTADDAEVGIDSDGESSATAGEEGKRDGDADMDVADDVDQWL